MKVPADDPNSQWSARVSLRIASDYIPNVGRGQYRGRHGWERRAVPDIIQFAATKDPEELENIIAHAQLAILNPTQNPSDFIPGPSRDLIKKKRLVAFSPNLVGIEISQPNIPALTFIDLPGVIAQTEDDSSQFLVKYVREMVSTYIKDPDTLILVTCSLATDIANSTAANIAREHKATERCIGVLTKPDCLPPGSKEETLHGVFSGRFYKLGHGYFVVKNPSQNDIDGGIGHLHARRVEEEFFNITKPWSSSLSHYRVQFGTPNLQAYLSKTLATQSLRALPKIYEQISLKLAGVEHKLSKIPDPPAQNAVRIISDLLQKFCDHVRKEMEGEFPHKDWLNTWEALREDFSAGLSGLKPILNTSGQLDQGILGTSLSEKPVDNSIVIIDDSNDEEVEVPPKRQKIGHIGTSFYVSPQNPLVRAPSGAGSPALPLSSSQPNAKQDKSRQLNGNQHVFQLDEVAKYLSDTSKSKIPEQLEPKVVNALVLSTLQHWDRLLAEFFGNFESALRSQLRKIFSEHFSQWDQSSVFGKVLDGVEDLLRCNFSEQDVMAAESLVDEREGPYIFPKEVLVQQKEQVLASYRNARVRARTNIYRKEYKEKYNRAIPSGDAEKARIHAITSQEPYPLALGTAATVTAYYMIASQRFQDAVCMRIESKLFKRLKDNLREELESTLKIFDVPDGLENAVLLLAQPAYREAERRELIEYKNALLQGQRHLDDLKDKYGYAFEVGNEGNNANGEDIRMEDEPLNGLHH
ncbi:interferon-induced GTP-binding protein Mx [Dendryphion nanum]|uniref:Interferon-induced GTP-binding protein Mx n=1 Tax=Dendryphion nanum TaxID=256645 RepID=A0A9P9IH24_9PLEO|nr:interferon-induced GTP-binding protein Mx [Dendryphion nanum]